MKLDDKLPLLLGVTLIFTIAIGASFLFPKNDSVTKTKLELAIDEYLKKGIFVNFDPSSQFGAGTSDQYYRNALRLLRNKYNRKDIEAIAINEPISDKYVNIYLFDEDPNGAFIPFKQNCTYTGYRNIIICDIGYIRRTLLFDGKFGEDIEEGVSELSPEEIRTMLQSVVNHVFLWVIGHEIGHIAHGHTGKEFNFDGDKWSLKSRYKFASKDPRESDADLFAVESVGNQGVGFFLWLGLSQIAANPQIFSVDHSNTDKIVLSDCSMSHEPLFKRAIVVAQKTIDSGFVVDSTGHFQGILDKIILNSEHCQ
jgi:hypothetical protein